MKSIAPYLFTDNKKMVDDLQEGGLSTAIEAYA
jgi:hypothetical protein